MIQALLTGANGLRSQQINIDVIGNNVANINTFGYKNARVDFKDALYNRMRNPLDNGEHMNLQHGTGVLPMQANRIFHQGPVLETDRTLDFMLEGDGFFMVEDTDGELLFTRGGSFQLSMEDDLAFLVTPDGRYVLDENGGRITVNDAGRLGVLPDGSLVTTGEDGEDILTGIRIGVAAFINPAGLEVVGDNFFRESENSGPPELMNSPRVLNRALEGSNVDYATEITRLLRAQRAYQMASRCVNTADQMAGLANSIRQ